MAQDLGRILAASCVRVLALARAFPEPFFLVRPASSSGPPAAAGSERPRPLGVRLRLIAIPSRPAAAPVRSAELAPPSGRAAASGAPLTPERLPAWAPLAFVALVAVVAVWHEARTSALQALLLSRLAAHLSFEVQPGASPRVVYPVRGPFDQHRGYSRLPDFGERLQARGYAVVEQARFSPALAWLAAWWGVTPPYREPAHTRLLVRAGRGEPLYDPAAGERVFAGYDEIPPLLARALLFIENRELAEAPDPRRNPAVEWDRLAKAGLLFVGRRVGLSVPVEGGSTLATQLEKYRHSDGGRTGSVREKLVQMASASLKAYRDGPDTRPVRRAILLDYINTVPLAAVAGRGEVHGLGAGLQAWFGLDLEDVRPSLANPAAARTAPRDLKHALALLCAVRAPSRYLNTERAALEARTNAYFRMLAAAGVIPPDLAARAEGERLVFAPMGRPASPLSPAGRKAVDAVRRELLPALGASGFYELDRLHLEVRSTFDPVLQEAAGRLLKRMRDPAFVAANGLSRDRLLADSDPRSVVYSLLLVESTPQGNLVRAQVDTLGQPLDLNDGMKLELGSTAKLRTLAHYLEVVAELHRELGPGAAADDDRRAADPLTRWAAAVLAREPHLAREPFLQAALDRRYSASPGEVFFTGGGVHTFANFEPEDDARVVTVREALRRSVNLPFVRLMRDLVRYHEARLPYGAAAVRRDAAHPERRRLLAEIADAESRQILARAWRSHHGLGERDLAGRLAGPVPRPRALAALYGAWHEEPTEQGLRAFLARHGARGADAAGLFRGYVKPSFGLLDYGYVLRRHPLEVWAAGRLARDPQMPWSTLMAESAEARRACSAWLLETRVRRAQDVRLRTRVEQDAFARMGAAWRRLGFPFERLVPSYATALGSSGDRPAALAELMGIVLNDGVRRPARRITELRFAEGTPYHMVLAPQPTSGVRVMDPAVARALRGVLAEVVKGGTGRRVAGAFRMGTAALTVGGKTGSGDNRLETYGRGGVLRSSEARSRTATFVFYVGDRWFGVITAFVPGRRAERYAFTSALPLTVLRLYAPAINARLSEGAAARRSSKTRRPGA